MQGSSSFLLSTLCFSFSGTFSSQLMSLLYRSSNVPSIFVLLSFLTQLAVCPNLISTSYLQCLSHDIGFTPLVDFAPARFQCPRHRHTIRVSPMLSTPCPIFAYFVALSLLFLAMPYSLPGFGIPNLIIERNASNFVTCVSV